MSVSFETLGDVIRRSARQIGRDRAFDDMIAEEEKKSDRKRSKKKKKKRVYVAAFAPLLYRGTLGTPKAGHLGPYWGPGTADGSSGTASGGGTAGGDAGATGTSGGASLGASRAPSSRARVLHELKAAMGLLEFGGGAGSAGASANWQGYAVPNQLAVKIRTGGPTIGGPGFSNNGDERPSGGVYNPSQSPGLGFRTDGAWRVWKAALDVMSGDKTLPSGAILQAAFQRSGVKMPDLDPAEVRLLEMGVEWYLSDPVPYAAKRDSGFGPSGGSAASPDMISGGS